MKLRHAAALTAIVILIAGCASQNSLENTDSTQKNDSTQKTVAGGFGCNISQETALRLCNDAARMGKATQYQQSDDSPHPSIAIISNAEHTVKIGHGIETPDRKIAAGVICEINKPHASVVYVIDVQGPHDQKEADYLRSQGLCSDSN